MTTKEATYNETQIAENLKSLPGWWFEDGWIRRVYKTDGWPTTLMLVGAIGFIAEAAYHHPDLAVTWGRITVKLSTHSAGEVLVGDAAGLRRRAQDRRRRAVETGRLERARDGHAEQVREKRRSAYLMHRLFVTGKLAEPGLRRVLADMAPAFQYDIAVLNITVAALMTTDWIASHLRVAAGIDAVMIPGLCEGDETAIGEKLGVTRSAE